MKWRFGLEMAGQGMQKVKQAGIDGLDAAATVISQDIVNFSQGGGIIFAIETVAHRQPLIRVKVVKLEFPGPMFTRTDSREGG